MSRDRGYRPGVDVGGTFTDLVLTAPDGCALTRKVLSSVANYAEAIIEGAAALLADAKLAMAATPPRFTRRGCASPPSSSTRGESPSSRPSR